MTVPILKLRVECHFTNPPTPTGFGVFEGDKLIGILEYDTVKQAFERYQQMLKDRDERFSKDKP